MAAHIAHRGDITVREFVSEFAGASGTAKQKIILAETSASHVSLHDFFGRKKANTDNIAKLLAAIKRHTKAGAPRPSRHYRQSASLSNDGDGWR